MADWVLLWIWKEKSEVMDVRNCRSCGRLFNYVSGPPICQACKDKLELKFQDVKEYIRENPHAPIQAVSTDNDVSVQQIKQWVREERLTFSEDSPIGIECENCGKIIKTGRFCEECKNKMKDNLSSVLDKPKVILEPKKPARDGEKMRFLDSMK